jgi:hypothetical protein
MVTVSFDIARLSWEHRHLLMNTQRLSGRVVSGGKLPQGDELQASPTRPGTHTHTCKNGRLQETRGYFAVLTENVSVSCNLQRKEIHKLQQELSFTGRKGTLFQNGSRFQWDHCTEWLQHSRNKQSMFLTS